MTFANWRMSRGYIGESPVGESHIGEVPVSRSFDKKMNCSYSPIIRTDQSKINKLPITFRELYQANA